MGPFDVGVLSYVPGLDIASIIGGVVGGVVGLLLLIGLFICVVVCCYQRKVKQRFQILEKQLDAKDMELSEKYHIESMLH